MRSVRALGSSRWGRGLLRTACAAGAAILLSGLSGCVVRGGYGCGPIIWEIALYGHGCR